MGFTYNSHPVASTNGTVGVGSVNASARTSLEHLAAGAGNGVGLGSRLAGSGGVGTVGTSLLVVLRVGLTSGLGNSLSVLLVLVDGPVENVIILEALTNEEISEDLAEVAVIGLVIEAEGSGIVKIDGKLVRETTAKDLGRGGHLLLHDAIILLLLGSSLETLPGKGTTAEVEHDVAQRLHIVSSGLLNTQMSVDRCVTSSSGKVLVLSVRNVEVSLGVSVLLGQAEIDNVDLVATLANAHKEVIGLDVSMDEGLGVDVLDTRDELIGQEKDGLEGEFSVTEVEEILQTGTEEIENHGIVVTLGTEPANKRNADTTSQRFVDTGLILQLGVLGLDGLELDGNLLSRDYVGAEINITERA